VKHWYLPFPPMLEQCPELAPLAILDVALSAVEYTLKAVCPEITYGTPNGATASSIIVRANALILQARKLAAAIAAYRDAVERDTRRTHGEQQRRTF
jgi:hypothetical protein